MPVISRFYGITIKMYFRQKEHNPPHLHAMFGEYLGVFVLETGEMIEGDMPRREQQMVERFIEGYRKDLLQMWLSQEFKMLPPVE